MLLQVLPEGLREQLLLHPNRNQLLEVRCAHCSRQAGPAHICSQLGHVHRSFWTWEGGHMHGIWGASAARTSERQWCVCCCGDWLCRDAASSLSLPAMVNQLCEDCIAGPEQQLVAVT